MEKSTNSTLPEELVIRKIHLIRGQKVLLDRDLAELYGVETKYLKRQVRRNLERFPEDFMFELTTEELEILRSQFGTSSWGGTRYLPLAFTEQGVAMLSGVLKSPVAIQVNIQIIRVFTKMRELLLTHKDTLLRLEQLERGLSHHQEEIQTIFTYLEQLLKAESEPPLKRVGFRRRGEED
ncbi:ORF6N domain-containing protein [bacterium SCSIO 12741]|nr:ORF6N domain-containing protein [bacterium SCSIO 12741]